jgi:hypothetical protein
MTAPFAEARQADVATIVLPHIERRRVTRRLVAFVVLLAILGAFGLIRWAARTEPETATIPRNADKPLVTPPFASARPLAVEVPAAVEPAPLARPQPSVDGVESVGAPSRRAQAKPPVAPRSTSQPTPRPSSSARQRVDDVVQPEM